MSCGPCWLGEGQHWWPTTTAWVWLLLGTRKQFVHPLEHHETQVPSLSRMCTSLVDCFCCLEFLLLLPPVPGRGIVLPWHCVNINDRYFLLLMIFKMAVQICLKEQT